MARRSSSLSPRPSSSPGPTVNSPDPSSNPFHPVSVFDTVTLAGVAYGQTVLARAVQAAGFDWNSEEAHSAVYDAERTADLFCKIVNGWPYPWPSTG